MNQNQRPEKYPTFSSAAVALAQQPPSGAARMVTLGICAMAALGVLYASFATIDVVVTGQGRVIAPGKSRIIQSFEPGVVKAIQVRDGQSVKSGDLLLELDATGTQADSDRLQREVWQTGAEMVRLTALAGGREDWSRMPVMPAEIAANQKAVLAERRGEQEARMAAMDADVARRSADRDAITASIAQLRSSLPMVQRKNEMREELARTGHIAETGLIETRLELISMQKELAIQGSRLHESEAGVAASVQQRKQAQAEFSARVSTELVEVIRKHDVAQHDLLKAEQRRGLQSLRSPVDGTVQQLAVTTLGGVVTQAQPLMTIVPQDAALEVEAQVMNRDIGHIKVGQRVINKVETFDFTRFGYIEGVVLWVGTDAVNDQKLGPVYPVRIRLLTASTPQSVNGVRGVVSAGMSMTSDIRTGERRLIEYFIAPMLRYSQEALRER